MRKYNDQLLKQLLNDKWSAEGIDAEVEVSSKPYFEMLTFRTVHKKKEVLDYDEIAEEAITQLKEQINSRRQGSNHITIVPWDEFLLFARFDGVDGRFWGDVVVTIRIKMLYRFTQDVYISADDIEYARRYCDDWQELGTAEEQEEQAAELFVEHPEDALHLVDN